MNMHEVDEGRVTDDVYHATTSWDVPEGPCDEWRNNKPWGGRFSCFQRLRVTR